MTRALFLSVLVLFAINTYAQYTIKLLVRKSKDKKLLAGATATIATLAKTTTADSTGVVVFENIPQGHYTIKVSFVGLQEQSVAVQVPQVDAMLLEVMLEEAEEHGEEVVVTATRISRTITNTPTRTEVISGEELTEKGNMKPGDIRMMLNESTGIQEGFVVNGGIKIKLVSNRLTNYLFVN